MRHLRSIFYALVLAPAIWVLAGVGFTHDLSSRGRELFAAESISGLLLLIFSGILYAILTFAPVSPAGPVLAGAAYLGVTIWAFNAPEAYAGLWAPEVSKEGFDLSRPGYGLAALLAIPLLATALSARRWARYEPPVLPIIGEISLFRGKATAPGIPMSIAETTVLRAGVPVTADRTVALPSDADRTVAITTAAAAASTAASPAIAPAAAAAPAVVSSAKADPDAGRAWDPTIAVRTPDEEAKTFYVVSPDETTSASVGPSSANKSGITTNPETAGKAVKKADDQETERLPRPPAEEPTRALPAADATQPVLAADATQPVLAADATQALPRADAGQQSPADAT